MDDQQASSSAQSKPSPAGVPPAVTEAAHVTVHKRGGLGQLASTAICGNDITSSCLYVSALAIIYAGRWAPVSLLVVGGVLFLFRSIYAEVVGALPLNGGAYNALLNTTSKFRASIAACLTILSYMATAVISAVEAMHYVDHLWAGLPVTWATVGLLAFFMCLTIIGITESAKVAIAIFLTHLVTLSLLLVVGVGALFFGDEVGRTIDSTSNSVGGMLSILGSNFEADKSPDLVTALFFGFAAAMLGISGFESSSNFVEEQAEGVFPKTLRNMWIAVSFFNPMMALLALALVRIGEVEGYKEALLAHLGDVAAGPWLATLVSVDATLVLSGAVLTSFVGVNGLVRRMTLDRCLPQFLLKTNRRGTTHRIIIAFFLLAVSVLFITKGEIKALAGVYTISFLAVMALFGLGNVLLKVKRSGLPRPTRASWGGVVIAIVAVLTALVGNVLLPIGEDETPYWVVFLRYFIPAMLIIAIMLSRIALLKACLFVVRGGLSGMAREMGTIMHSIRDKIEEINSQQIVFFTRGDNIANLNRAMLYVKNNEQTNRIKFVTVVQRSMDVPEKLKKDLEFLDEAYPEIDIEFVVLEGVFGPELVKKLSETWEIPTNLMFIGSPGTHFMFGLAELGGVRLII